MAEITIKLREEVAQYVTARAKLDHLEQSDVVADLVESGFEQKLRDLYWAYQEGEISLGFLAEKVGMTTWQLYHLLDERGWRIANV